MIQKNIKLTGYDLDLFYTPGRKYCFGLNILKQCALYLQIHEY